MKLFPNSHWQVLMNYTTLLGMNVSGFQGCDLTLLKRISGLHPIFPPSYILFYVESKEHGI